MDLRIHWPSGITVVVILAQAIVVVAKRVEVLDMEVMGVMGVMGVMVVTTVTMVVERGIMAREMHMINFIRMTEEDHRISSMVNAVTQTIIHILHILTMMTMVVTVIIEVIMDMEGGMEVHHNKF